MGEKKMRCVIISGSPDTNVEEIKSKLSLLFHKNGGETDTHGD